MKWFLVAMALVALALGFNLVVEKYKAKEAISKLNEELMKANLDLGKAHTAFGNANEYIGELESKLQDELKAKNETLSMYGELLAKYKAKGKGTVKYETVIETVEVPVEVAMEFNRHHFYWAETTKVMQDLGPVFGPSYYRDHRVSLSCMGLTEDDGVVVGHAYQLNLKLQGQLAQTTTESGAVNHYLTLWEIDDNGKRVGKFKLDKFEVTVEDVRKSDYIWWAPHVDVGLVGTYVDPYVAGVVGFSTSGFGKTANDLDLRFPHIGLTLSDPFMVSISPFLWNLGGPLPLVSNLWAGPSIILRKGGNLIGLTLNVVL